MRWPKTKKLGSLCNVLAGGTPSRSKSNYWKGDIPWVKISDMLQGHIRYTDESISIEGLENSAARMLPKGTLLLSIFATIGRTAILEIEAATNQAIVGLIPKRDDEINVGYLRRHLEAQVSSLVQQGRGGAQSNINGAILKNLDIPLPTLDEQKRIAAVLDKADALRRQRRESLQLTEKLLQSVFIDMFVKNPEAANWPPQSVEWIAKDAKGSMRTGPFGSQLLHSEFIDQGIAVLGIDNAVKNRFEWGQPRFISPKKYEDLRRYKVFPGDLIITIMGTLGRCAIVPDDIPESINTKHLCCITLDHKKCLPEFLHSAFLNHPDVLRQLGVRAKGAVMPGLNMGIIKDLTFPVPPIDLQKKFSDIIAATAASRIDFETSQKGADQLFNSLQQRAFRGELDLSRLVLDPPDDTPTPRAPAKPVTQPSKPKAAARFLQAPEAIEAELKRLDVFVNQKEMIPWSADYCKYRILGAKAAPFGFAEVMQRAEEVFDRFHQDEPLLYDQVRDVIFDLLGQDGKPALLRQRFDLQTNQATNEVTGRKEIVFEPMP